MPGAASVDAPEGLSLGAAPCPARGALERDLTALLRTFCPIRRSEKRASDGQKVGQVADAVSIAERTASMADRAIHGHREGDLTQGANFSIFPMLGERLSRHVHLMRVTSKEADNGREPKVMQRS